jgi:C4-dicarboxylate transporter DctM subunit
VFALFRLYNGIWRYASVDDMNRIIGATLVTAILNFIGTTLFLQRLPVSYYVVGTTLQFIFITLIRFSYRFLVFKRRGFRESLNPGMPVIIIGGIYGGLFSPTEAGAISALYAILIGVFLYRKLNGKGLLKCFSATGRSLGIILVVMPLASVFTKIMIMKGFPDQVMSVLTGFAGNRVVLLLLLDFAFLIAGCFFEANVLTLVIPPIMMPTMNALGIDPVQFGNIVFVAIGIGAATPPMASALFMSAKIADVKIADVVKPLMPFLLLVALPIMLLVTFVPELSLWLPRLVLGA